MNDNLEHFRLRKRAMARIDRVIAESDAPLRFQQLKAFIPQNQRAFTFCASFSENPDQLSQWRAYAAGGAGVAIGFDSRYLRPQDVSKGVELRKVVYDEHEQDEMLAGL